jgi:hypothetical protein
MLGEKKDDGGDKRDCTQAGKLASGSSLLTDLNFQAVSGLYKNISTTSPSES